MTPDFPIPCPFCEARRVSIVEDLDGELVLCLECGGRGPSCATEADAVAGWNRRGAAPAPSRSRPTLRVHDRDGAWPRAEYIGEGTYAVTFADGAMLEVSENRPFERAGETYVVEPDDTGELPETPPQRSGLS